MIEAKTWLAAGGVSPPSAADVRRIAALADRTIRNLEITQCYADLSAAMRTRAPAANWCTFATWASRQAGSTIRGEDLLDRLRQRLGERAGWLAPWEAASRWLLRKGVFDERSRIGRAVAVVHTPFDAFARASDAVAAGNLKVFAEIGEQFARFLAIVPAGAGPESEAMQAFLRGLRPGPPPAGQDHLAAAFRRYAQQCHEPEPAARAASILLANLEIGLHEQTRLQPEIASAMDAPAATAADLGARLLRVFVPSSRRWPRLVRRPVAAVLGWPARGAQALAMRVTREIVTEAMMVLRLPHQALLLGRDLDVAVPAVFQANPHDGLARFMRAHDPCASGATTCGADDWSDLNQRMHYIVHLFRGYADEPALFSPPFTQEQVACVRAGTVPRGEL